MNFDYVIYVIPHPFIPRLDDILEIVHPEIQMTFENFLAFINGVFVFQMKELEDLDPKRKRRAVHLKGQLILLQNGKHMLYLCSPNVTTVRELLDKSLHLSDIPLHDATRDLILLNQSRMSQVELNKKLEETTLELKKMAEDLEAEKEKTDSLLRELLPASVAEQLRHGKTVDACKNCCFSQSKVETIGDAYMVVGGVPEECANHAVKVCNMAIGMLWESRSVLSPVTNRPIQVRLKFESKVKRRTCEFAYLLSEAEGLESVNTLKLFTSDENQSIDGYSELHDTSGLVNAKKGNENPKMEQNGAVAASETVQGNSREPADINRSFFKFRKNRVADVGPSKSCCIM